MSDMPISTSFQSAATSSAPWQRWIERLSRVPLVARLLIIVFLVVAATVISRWSLMLEPMWLADNDDMLRLLQVHDFLAGQSWFDLRQYRLEPPTGGDIHWSRIADIGLILPMAFARLFTTDIWADRIAVIVYPSLILFALLWLMVKTARQLGGNAATLPAIYVTLTSGSMLLQMLPGRIDHHGLQILFMVVLMVQGLQPQGRTRGLIAGLMMALSLGVGLETLPYVAVAQAGLWWLWSRHSADACFVRGVGLGMVGGCALVLLGTIKPSLWLMPYNDSFGRAHAAALLAGGIFWVLLSSLKTQNVRQRAMTGGALGVGLAALLLLAFPELSMAPYAKLDPFLKRWFMDNVQEAAPLYKYARVSLSSAVMDAVFALVALALAVKIIWSETNSATRDRWLFLLGFLLAAFAVALVQVRAFSFVGAFAILPCAIMIARLRSLDLRPLALTCVWIFLSMPGAGVIGRVVEMAAGRSNDTTENKDGSTACVRRADVAPLNAYPQGLMINPIDLGTRILAFSHHNILASPYHRVQRGMKASVAVYLAPAKKAEAIARAHRADYIIYCPSLPEADIFLKAAPNGLLADLEKNQVPAWLEPIALPDGNRLRLYRVKDETP